MFSVVIPGRPCLTDIVAVDRQPTGEATKFAFTIPASPPFSVVVVFLLPGTVLPAHTGAAIYLQQPDPSSGAPQDFRFIGALANERPSAIFTVRSQTPGSDGPHRTEAEEEDEMLDEGASNLSGGGDAASAAGAVVTLGISIEASNTIAQQLSALEMERPRPTGPSQPSTALVVQPAEQRQQKQISTKVLAQRIIGSAFNFLASFAESDPSNKGYDVVPLKSFRDWWTKFERRVEMDPGFLEREDPNAT